MQLSLTFKEVEEYVAKNFQKNISLQHIDNKSVSLSLHTEQKSGLMGFVNKMIKSQTKINLSIKSIENNNVTLSYNENGVLKSFLVSSALKLLKTKANDIYKELEDNNLIIYLQKIEQLGKVFEYCNLKDIYFNANSVVVDMIIK